MFGDEQLFGLAIGRGEVDVRLVFELIASFDFGQILDQLSSLLNTKSSFCRAGFRATSQPLHFTPDFALQGLLNLLLDLQELIFFQQKLAVIAIDGEDPFGITGIQLDHTARDVLQKDPVVRDHQVRKGGGLKELLKP